MYLLTSDGVAVPIRKSVLAAHSKVFEDLFESLESTSMLETAHLDLPSLSISESYEDLLAALRYIFSELKPIEEEHRDLCIVYTFADKYDCRLLQSHMVEKLR
jgi:hypothetical protein